MPTSSIFHNFIISDPDDVNRFISAIEKGKTSRRRAPGKLITDRNEIAALMIRNKKRRNILGGNAMNKTELALKHFEERVLSGFLCEFFEEEDDKFILLKKYLPYTLKELKNSKDENNMKFLKLLEEYDWETNATEEDRAWYDNPNDFCRCGKFICCFPHQDAQLIRNEIDVLNGIGAYSGGEVDYTIFVEFCEGAEFDGYHLHHNYALELSFYEEDDDEDEDNPDDEDIPDELPCEIVGLGISIFNLSPISEEIVAYPFNTSCMYTFDDSRLKLVDKRD